MQGCRILSPTEGQRHERELLRECLPITGHHLIVLAGPEGHMTIPFVLIDAKGRPDVADLARVHLTEGQGEVTAQWSFALRPNRVLAIVTCELSRPVRCRFSLAFRLPKNAGVLRDIVTMGGFVVATSPPVKKADGALDAPGIFLEVPTRDIAGVLAMTQLIPVA